MKVQNKSRRIYQHSFYNAKGVLQLINLCPGEILDIDDKVAQVWLKTGDVIEYADPKDHAKLEDENAKLKAELAALKDKEKCGEVDNSIEALKKEADKLGIKYAKNIGREKLLAKINDFKEQ